LRISERCIGWRESDVEHWLSNPDRYSRQVARDPLGLDWD